MPVRDDPRARGRERGRRLIRAATTEWRDLRLAAGLSQRAVAQSIGISRSTYARIEQGRIPEIGIIRASTLTSVLGGDLAVRVYPNGSPVRDTAHLALLADIDRLVTAAWRVTHESPIRSANDREPWDRRAWDRLLVGPVRVGLEAETRLRDVQALEREMHLKLRDSGVDRMVLVIRGSTSNRAVVREHLGELRSVFPLGTGETLQALRSGRDPCANGLVLL